MARTSDVSISLCLSTLIILLTASHCASEIEHDQPANNAQALTVYKPAQSNDLYLLVCWEQRGYDRQKELVRSAVESNWMRYSRLVFADWGDCTSSTVGIRITLENGDDPSPSADSKYGRPRIEAGFEGSGSHSRDLRMTFDFKARAADFPECLADTGAMDACIRTIGVHEVGHALGLIHEQERYTSVKCENKLGQDYPMLKLSGDNVSELGPFDQDSIMAACNLAQRTSELLTPNDIFYLQQTYGAKAASALVSFDGRCLDFGAGDADGSGAQTYECLGGTSFSPANVAADHQYLHFDVSAGTIGLGDSERVMTVPRNDAASGNQLQLAASTSAPGQKWKLPKVLLRSMGEMCVAPVTPNSPMYSELVLVKCSASEQSAGLLFSLEGDGSIVHSQSGLCLQASDMLGSRLQLQPCTHADNQSWVQADKSALKPFAGSQDLCIDIGLARNDLNRFFGSDGYNRLQVFTCNGQPNQMFSVAGPMVGLEGKCLDVAQSERHNGTTVRLWQCSGQENQVWELYW